MRHAWLGKGLAAGCVPTGWRCHIRHERAVAEYKRADIERYYLVLRRRPSRAVRGNPGAKTVRIWTKLDDAQASTIETE